MTAHAYAYRAGAIACEIDARYTLTTACLGNIGRLPTKLPVWTRHVWDQALGVPDIVALLDGWESPPGAVYTAAHEGSFWLGYYGQRIARDLPATFPARLRSLREQAGLSVGEMAAKTGLTRAPLFKLEAGDTRPTWDTVQKLAQALGVTTDTFRDPPEPPR